jgi:hypothetical protein
MKIVFLIIILLTFSARAEEDYSQYYFTGIYSLERNKQYDGSVETKRFHIYDNKGFLDVDFEYHYLDKIPDGNKKLISDNGTKISFNIKNGEVSSLNILSKNIKEKKENIGDSCRNAAFFYQFLSANELENFKEKEGKRFVKYYAYQSLDNALSADILFIMQKQKEQKLQVIGTYMDGDPISLSGRQKFNLELISEKDRPSSDSYILIPMKENDTSEKHLEINDCAVIYYKDSKKKFIIKE